MPDQRSISTYKPRLVRSTAQCADGRSLTLKDAAGDAVLDITGMARLTGSVWADQALTVDIYQGEPEDAAAGVWPWHRQLTIGATPTDGSSGWSVEAIHTRAKVTLTNSSGTDTMTCIAQVSGRAAS